VVLSSAGQQMSVGAVAQVNLRLLSGTSQLSCQLTEVSK
jgi:hypothetical protein